MKGLILAAGFGKRLQPITNKIPKCLVEVKGKPLLVSSLNNMKKVGIDEAIIVTGHKNDIVISTIGFEFNGMKIIYVHNKNYESTNNIYSLWLARDYIDDDIILAECDLYYNVKLLEDLLTSDADCTILTSDFNEKTMDGTIIEIDSNYRAKALVTKKAQGKGYNYSNSKKTINIYKFSKNFIVEKFIPSIDNYIKSQNANSYYELVLGSLIYYNNDNIKVINEPENLWYEIDNIEDLDRANQSFF
jgi:choline kinase